MRAKRPFPCHLSLGHLSFWVVSLLSWVSLVCLHKKPLLPHLSLVPIPAKLLSFTPHLWAISHYFFCVSSPRSQFLCSYFWFEFCWEIFVFAGFLSAWLAVSEWIFPETWYRCFQRPNVCPRFLLPFRVVSFVNPTNRSLNKARSALQSLRAVIWLLLLFAAEMLTNNPRLLYE